MHDAYFVPNLNFGPMFYKKMSLRILGSYRSDYTWSRIQMIMGLTGKLLNYENLNNIKIHEDAIKFSFDNSQVFKYKFGSCEIFDTTGVDMDNLIIRHIPSKYKVYDDYEISILGGKHTYLEPKISDDELAREIHYYNSGRVDGANYVTDCVTESILTKDQLNNSEYSDSIGRFCVLRHLESIGVRGSFMKMYKNGTPKYRKPKVAHKRRTVLEKEQNIYEDTQNVKVVDYSMKEIFSATST
ncbi:MAG: hypothetical protein CBD16_07095 [Betaproteobacteria bacterium TMED156]|nr:MAG: hypothetical protein CBD16_07095 [Betaproteobacteria bacterium TMED156]